MEELSKAEATGEADAAVLEGIGEAYFSLKNYDKSLDVYNRLRKGERPEREDPVADRRDILRKGRA